jgi:hypothetical protein
MTLNGVSSKVQIAYMRNSSTPAAQHRREKAAAYAAGVLRLIFLGDSMDSSEGFAK